MQPDVHDLFSDKTPDILIPNRIRSPWDFSAEPSLIVDNPHPLNLPQMAPRTRSSAKIQTVESYQASGSEYSESPKAMDIDDLEEPPAQSPEPSVEYAKTSKGRRVVKKSYAESADSDDEDFQGDGLEADGPGVPPDPPAKDTVPEDHNRTRYSLRTRRSQIIISDEDDEGPATRYQTRNKKKLQPSEEINGTTSGRLSRRNSSRKRKSAKPRQSAREQHDEDGYVDASSDASADAEGSLDGDARTSSDLDLDDPAGAIVDGDDDAEQEESQDNRYSFRQRAKVNYAIPPPLEEMAAPSQKKSALGRTNGRGGTLGGKRAKPPGWSATGAELSRWMGGGAGDDSDSDYGPRPRRPFGVNAGAGMVTGGTGNTGMLPTDLAGGGGPSNLGKVGDASLADVDPLGVNQSVTFDEVGGLDDHINSLKEMTLLPLLYPEVFQQFGLTPPRGVLFHGPPGTGKTLLARALAASCRSNGRGISFFMRKGADCLSKWVGEAERQLRLLFEEARNQQPSIIFFDEIDGLAPVRSSKQDQIHASIVSTLLALMDGMDGRGQVIVIGATNRPDAIDPALRRPGRFDREFYFPLPNLPARERILTIMTRKWAGWEDSEGEEKVKGLAQLTKGYGGADLRALCTEAALNAIQRRYPQIYKSIDRLLLNPESIKVQLRDFMIAVQKMVPSSARATAPPTTPLPTQLEPLLNEAVQKTKSAISRVISTTKKRTALEEAEWEEDSEEGALKRELALQSMEVLRVYRPRVVLYGGNGMGQRYVAEAALHGLDGFHIHGLDLAHLLSDSARTPEAALVQLFTEAKRHKPAVIYIPSLSGWCSSLAETARSTVLAMLESLAPTDPVLLLAYVDGPFSSLPQDVQSWFGMRGNRVEVTSPSASARESFFADLLQKIRMPPNHFPDSVGRKKRILEELPLAPPLEPRAPTAAELELQAESDRKVILQLKVLLGGILTELKRKFKRFTKNAADEYGLDPSTFLLPIPPEVAAAAASAAATIDQPGEADTQGQDPTIDGVNGVSEEPIQQQVQLQPQFFDMDLERIHIELYRSKYLTPQDFLDDIRKIVHNAEMMADLDTDRLFRAQALLTTADLSTQNFDVQFRLECQRMAIRERRRREEYRKSKDKSRAADAEGQAASSSEVYPPGTRRSARNNGQQPELEITDPLQLERRLKRQRSAELVAEVVENSDEDNRSAKRTRTTPEESAINGDPPDPTQEGSPRPHVVRFADDARQTLPLPPLPEDRPPQDIPVQDVPVEGIPTQEVPVPEAPVQEIIMQETPVQQPPVVETRTRPAFEMLLNPEPEIVTPLPLPNGLGHSNEMQPSLLSPPPAEPHATASSVQDVALPEPVQVNGTVDVTQSMEVCEPQKEDTPPPEFIIDETLVSHLFSLLRESTHPLNVEQLEELRATCLNAIWQHRSDWNRTLLIEKLCDLVKDYVEELSDSSMNEGSPRFR